MITEIWWLNRALMVGMPRRSTEWSTESSWTRVARWISSITAARVGARGSRRRGRFLGQQQQRGPEHLALHLQQVAVHLGDEAEVALDDPAQLALHRLQPSPEAAPADLPA